MNFIRLVSENDKMFNTAIELYKNSFPKHEQRSHNSQYKILNYEEYHFDLIYDNDLFVGIILYWEAQNFLYVEHFCINTETRNKKYGQRALELLNDSNKTVILEIDPPTDEISLRRKGFYNRIGYKENDYKHIHPPYNNKYIGHELVIMSYPNLINQSEYNEFEVYLKNKVMAN